MYELSVALKYLLPKRRQLSVSIISLISILVISLVVWLILVFFSVTNGLEKIWVDKMISLTAPIRILPTDKYYDSYYYKIDAYSSGSDYTLKSISEKLKTAGGDPYDPEIDEELPVSLRSDAPWIDLAKEAFAAVESLGSVKASPFEMTAANLKLKLIRENKGETTEQMLSQTAYIGSFDPNNTSFKKTLLPLSDEDKQNAKSDMIVTEKDGIYHLPQNVKQGYGILLPKSFKDAGVWTGDRGYILYHAPTASMVQEQRAPVFVAGFYDPGVIPIGGKFIWASSDLTGLIRSNHNAEDLVLGQGINLRLPLSQVDSVKNKLSALFEKKEIAPYFKIETYKEFDFTKDLIQQLHSEKNIFSLISTVIIIVACSNIISMLIILVNDKKTEIGILRSMGASSASIAFIFGFAGTVMGILGSAIGIALALLTLKNLNFLINLISRWQGFQAFNPMFFGNEMPSEVSPEALFFVIAATLAISMLSGLVPAIKASRLKPAQILRSE